MIIGVPRERKTLEKRIAITPDGANKLTSKGHTVLIEKDAGVGSYFSNDSFKEAGCKIVDTLAEVWNESELVVKVKEPHEEEFQYFRKDVTLFDYLHLASMPDVTNAMLDGGLTGIAYELVQTPDGKLPLLEPMSEVAGKLSVLNGSYFLLSQNGGRGVLTGGAIGVDAAQVVVVGAGIAGRAACEIALGMGADVTVLDISHSALERIKLEFDGRVRGLFSTPGSLARACAKADLLIGAVLIPGAAAPKLITKDIISSMKQNSVFVDISIDQGGCGETIKPTSLDEPVYNEQGVIHYGVCNMPAQVPVTSTKALTSATLPYIVELADKGISTTLKDSAILRNAVNTINGKLTNEAVSEAVGIQYTPVEEILN